MLRDGKSKRAQVVYTFYTKWAVGECVLWSVYCIAVIQIILKCIILCITQNICHNSNYIICAFEYCENVNYTLIQVSYCVYTVDLWKENIKSAFLKALCRNQLIYAIYEEQLTS